MSHWKFTSLRFVTLTVMCLVATSAAAAQDRIVEINEEVVVDAPLDAVWKALTTAEGLAGWMGDSARIELEIGGIFEVRHKVRDLTEEEKELARGEKASAGGMRNTHILSFVPGRMLSYEGGMAGTWNVWTLDEIAPGKVRVHHTGLGTSEDWIRMAPMFETAMQGVLDKLVTYLKATSTPSQQLQR
jgi:uncharacterized protein YndB with AHSA1/START domain